MITVDPLAVVCKLAGIVVAAGVLGGFWKAIGLIVALELYSASFEYWPRRHGR